MAKHILKCIKCKKYSLEKVCECGGQCIEVKPPKYSPDDKYENLRRKAKEEDLQNKGLI